MRPRPGLLLVVVLALAGCTTEVTAGGDDRSGECDANYSGCVPVASDVDCGGGSGNGPAYIHGSVRVVGADVYGLDADGDGTGCD
jgi:hypothetical protein